MLSDGKPYSIFKRNRIYYCQFKLPDGRWGTARSTHEAAKDREERWATDYLQAGQGKISVGVNTTLKEFSKGFLLREAQ